MSTNVTLRDIATKSGYSRSTVSLVMQNSALVADDTRTAVQKTAEELGYVYNRAAASLRSKQTGIFGLIISSLSNPFFAEMTLGIEKSFGESENTVLLGQHSENLATQERMIQTMLEMRVDGILLVAAEDTPKSVFGILDKWKVPTVLLTRKIKGIKAPYVGPNNIKAGESAADHLFDHKCKRIAFIGSNSIGPVQADRLQGVMNSAAAHKIAINKVEVVGQSASRQSGYEATKKLLEKGHEGLGIVAYNDIVAFGAMAALRDAGLNIGKDVAIIGIDDVEAARFENPALTTVSIDAIRIGEMAAELVVEMAHNATIKTQDLISDNTLTIRQSCGCNVKVRGRS